MERLRNVTWLIRSTPMRMALALVVLISAVNLSTFGLAYLHIRDNLQETIFGELDLHLAGFRAAATPEAIAALVATQGAAADPSNRVFVFQTEDGISVGNARATINGSDVQLSPGDDGRPLDADGYVSRVVPAGGGLLVVAESRAPFLDLENTFIKLTFVNLGPTIMLSLVAAVVIAQSSSRQVGRIEATLERIAGGELSARVTEVGRHGDLARIGAGVNLMAGSQEAATIALRQVSANIAHDLKTPLQRISVLLADLRDRLPENSPEAVIADRAAAESDRAVGVFQALLEIVLIEAGNARSRFVSVDLAKIASTFAEIYQPTAEDSGHLLTLALLTDGPVMVLGDKRLLGQVFANLIENAIRHTPRDTRIDISLARRNGRTELTVADTGPGIPENEHQKVLTRLYRLDHSRSTPGNGLGLALVAAIADVHEATVTLANNIPGLRVTINFDSASHLEG
ncbi:MAG: ATP-binding protein [Paracoccaceae bacterium]